MGFSPRRDDTLPVRSSCHISRLQGQKRGNTAPNTVKICNFADKFAPHGRRVCTSFTKFSAFIRVYRQLFTFYFGRFRGTNNQVISILPRWGHFPTNFQQPLAAKLLIGSKKSQGCNNGTDLLYHHANYDWDRGSCADCRRKSVMFFVSFLSRQFPSPCQIMQKSRKEIYLFGGKFIPKIANFGDFDACKPTFSKLQP